jgi:hypothetical protein
MTKSTINRIQAHFEEMYRWPGPQQRDNDRPHIAEALAIRDGLAYALDHTPTAEDAEAGEVRGTLLLATDSQWNLRFLLAIDREGEYCRREEMGPFYLFHDMMSHGPYNA